MAELRFEAVEKSFPGGHVALRGIDLAVADRELMVLVGPSGCGKSTALRLVAGLEAPTRGAVRIGGRDVAAVPPAARDVAMVFQSYALYPHMTVAANLGFGLRMRGVPAGEIARRVAAVAARLELEGLLDRRPAALSGGQRQRVALGRALARCGAGAESPAALLLDEPLSNLDARLRLEMRAELARLHRELGVTVLHVTHDQEEALTLGERIAVLRDGRLEQVGPPAAVYGRPASPFVADFVGTPPINWLRGRLEGGVAERRVAGPGFALAAPAGWRADPGADVVVGIRPRDLALADEAGALLRGRADVVERIGSEAVVHARGEAGLVFRVLVPADAGVRVGDRVCAAGRGAGLHPFDAASGRRLDGPPGD